MKVKRHVIPDPYPETIGVSALTIWIPEDFRGDAEIVWWYFDKTRDEDKHSLTCRATALLQGFFYDVRRGTAGADLGDLALIQGRVIALVLHEFYKQRIYRAAKLEAAYDWQAPPQELLK